jgi:CBS domain-containing membrane protein
MGIKNFIQSFKPHVAPVSLAEKMRSALAAGVGILLLGLALKLLPHFNYPLLMLGSMAASAVLLFAVPHSPMSQPWPLIGGHMISLLAGWMCSQFIPDPILAAGCAVGLSIFLMHYLNCLHPPGGATALILVLGSTQFQPMGWAWVTSIVAANAGISLLLALTINNLLPGRQYPAGTGSHAHSSSGPTSGTITIEQQDIAWATRQIDGFLDISEQDLALIYELATQHAQRRYKLALDARKIPRD